MSKPGVALNSVDIEIDEGEPVALEENIVEIFQVDKMVDFVDYGLIMEDNLEMILLWRVLM